MLTRISLTMEKELLGRIDALVDGETMKNRSQTVSLLLRNALKGMSVGKALVLAGKNNFLLDKILGWLKKNGITEVVIAVGKDENLRRKLESWEKGMNKEYSFDENKGTANAIKKAKHFLKEPFLLCYSDVFCEDLVLKDLLSFHNIQKAKCTLVLTWSKQPSKYGVAKMLGAKIIDFEEKPSSAEGFLINAGVAVCNPEVFDSLEEPSFEKNALPAMAAQGSLSGYVYYGKWVH
ncbi:MAG: sugar phosphate nucleotidyltransferase [Candidatus Norongarragalinales archaeon]